MKQMIAGTNNFQWRITVSVLALFLTACTCAYFLMAHQYLFAALMGLLLLVQLAGLIRYQQKMHQEMNQFVASVHYRDFSRYFDEKHAPAHVQPLRKGFNTIIDTFKNISREKEMQYQYVQKILELVDTGIFSYDVGSGEVIWMNESLKKMLQLPYLKSIQTLQKRDKNLFEEIQSLLPGESRISTIHLERSFFKVLLSATAFQTEGRTYKLIAFQNVNDALEETESKAWQKLLSVLTHEIMNSVAPISSLAGTLQQRLQHIIEMPGDRAAMEDLSLGIDTIRRRSDGLLRFAETYRSLNKITTLHVKKITARELFAGIYQLMQPMLEQKRIELEIILKEPELSIDADPALLEQVLINLVVNAADAVKEKESPRIVLSAETLGGKKIMKVADNGTGISGEVLDNIFIPFFSTKKTGSGIGLSLCKQIMLLHKGNIQAQSVEGAGTVFTLQFAQGS